MGLTRLTMSRTRWGALLVRGRPAGRLGDSGAALQPVGDLPPVLSIESFWSLLKRGYHGTFHHFSPKHMQRYVTEFAKRQSIREMGTLDQLKWLAGAMVGKRLRYADLTA